MMKAIFAKVMWLVRGMLWLGRGTATVLGLAVMLALVFGFAGTVLAANGNNFILGVSNNIATAVTNLQGTVANGATLRLANPSTSDNARALDLAVDAGNPPITVTSTAGKALNLDADKLDGKDSATYMSSGIYRTEAVTDQGTVSGDGSEIKTMSCAAGDRVLSGGPASVAAGSRVLDSFPVDTRTWQARIFPVSGGDNFTVVILCADQ